MNEEIGKSICVGMEGMMVVSDRATFFADGNKVMLLIFSHIYDLRHT